MAIAPLSKPPACAKLHNNCFLPPMATAAAMGTRTAQDLTLQLDRIIGSGFSAVWIGLLGLSLMATGLVLQSAQRFLRLLLVREFGLD